MVTYMKGTAKRLTISLLVAFALGGCAVYEPYNPEGGTFAGDVYPYGQPVYYSSAPYYVAPPASYRFESDRHYDARGSRGFRGDRHGLRDGRDRLQDGERRRHQDGKIGDGGSGGHRLEATPQQSSDFSSSTILRSLNRGNDGGGR